MKTPEEVLQEYVTNADVYTQGYDQIIAAMKEYARQVREAQVVRMADDLPFRMNLDPGWAQPHIMDTNRVLP